MPRLFTGILLLCLGFVTVVHSTAEYDLSQYCGSSIYVDSSAILRMNDLNYRVRDDCTVKIYSNLPSTIRETKLRMEILSFGASCGYNYLQLLDGSQFPLSVKLCDKIQDIETMYVTSLTNYMTVDLHRYSFGTDLSVKLLATATSNWYEAGEFLCDNGFLVASILQCDGYDNCGDWSDETSYLCNHWIGWHLQTAVIVGSVAVCVAVGIIITLLLVRSRRRRQQNQALMNQSQVHIPPVYGAIQGGYSPAVGNCPLPPPAYTAAKGVAGYPPPSYAGAVVTAGQGTSAEAMPPPYSSVAASQPSAPAIQPLSPHQVPPGNNLHSPQAGTTATSDPGAERTSSATTAAANGLER